MKTIFKWPLVGDGKVNAPDVVSGVYAPEPSNPMPEEFTKEELNKAIGDWWEKNTGECEMCHQKKTDVKLHRDPYLWEVNNSVVLRYLCVGCWEQRKDDI